MKTSLVPGTTPSLRRQHTLEPLEARIAPASLASGDIDINLALLKTSAGLSFKASYVEAAGDINGDYFDDLIVQNAGGSYVVFGKRDGLGVGLNLTALNGTNGFKVTGGSLMAAGDVNGDGFDDLLFNSSANAGVLYGKARGFTASFNLAAVNNTSGVRIENIYHVYGLSLGAYPTGKVGDFNGDGFDDVVFAVPDPSDGPSASLVVFLGARSFTGVQQLNGFVINDTVSDSGPGITAFAEAAGDVNADGFDDILVSTPLGTPETAFLVLGRANAQGGGLGLGAAESGPNTYMTFYDGHPDHNFSVSPGGDVTGDGIADLILFDTSSYKHASQATVLQGSATLDVYTPLTTQAQVTNNLSDAEFTGFYGQPSIGDFTGDGIADFFITAPFATVGTNADAGAGFLFPGSASTSAKLLTDGLTFGGSPIFKAGSAGDLNGDGFGDLLLTTSAGYSVVYGVDPHNRAVISADTKSATYTDPDGDKVTLTLSKPGLRPSDFTFDAAGTLLKLNFSDDGATFSGSDILVSVRQMPGGDGRTVIGHIDAHGIDLNTVKVSGNVNQIDAGNANLTTPAINRLELVSFGAVRDPFGVDAGLRQVPGAVDPLLSDVVGSLTTLYIHEGTQSAQLNVVGGTSGIGSIYMGGGFANGAPDGPRGYIKTAGDIGPVTILTSLQTDIFSGGKIGALRLNEIFGETNKPVYITAVGKMKPGSAADALTIASITVEGTTANARILAGYTPDLLPVNPDVVIGTSNFKGSFTNTSLVAGVADTTHDGFGRNDQVISGGVASIVSRITSVLLNERYADEGVHFGITAQQIDSLKLRGVPVPLSAGKDNVLLTPPGQNIRLVEI